MQGNVKVCADDMGNVIVQSKNNPEYGYIRLSQERVTFSQSGFVNKKSFSALLNGKIEDLQSLDFKKDDTIAGRIVVKESLQPFNNSMPDRDLKYAGTTGIVCTAEVVDPETGELQELPIYRKDYYTQNAAEQDVFIAHTNGQQIREANGAATPKSQLEALGVSEEVAEVKEEDNTQAEAAVESDVTEDVIEEEVAEVEEETFEL